MRCSPRRRSRTRVSASSSIGHQNRRPSGSSPAKKRWASSSLITATSGASAVSVSTKLRPLTARSAACRRSPARPSTDQWRRLALTFHPHLGGALWGKGSVVRDGYGVDPGLVGEFLCYLPEELLSLPGFQLRAARRDVGAHETLVGKARIQAADVGESPHHQARDHQQDDGESDLGRDQQIVQAGQASPPQPMVSAEPT